MKKVKTAAANVEMETIISQTETSEKLFKNVIFYSLNNSEVYSIHSP
jgi:hypothetical protein